MGGELLPELMPKRPGSPPLVAPPDVVALMERIFRCRDTANVRQVFLFAWGAAKQFAGPFEIVIRPLKIKRTGDQNRRYWALLRDVAATVWVSMPVSAGNRHSEWEMRLCSDEVWHVFFRREFIGLDEARMPDGTKIEVPISTTTLTVDEMTTYMRDIEQWCVEQGFPLAEAA